MVSSIAFDGYCDAHRRPMLFNGGSYKVDIIFEPSKMDGEGEIKRGGEEERERDRQTD